MGCLRLNITVDMLTGKGLKFSLKIGQIIKTFNPNHLSISIILLQKKTCVFFLLLLLFPLDKLKKGFHLARLIYVFAVSHMI